MAVCMRIEGQYTGFRRKRPITREDYLSFAYRYLYIFFEEIVSCDDLSNSVKERLQD